MRRRNCSCAGVPLRTCLRCGARGLEAAAVLDRAGLEAKRERLAAELAQAAADAERPRYLARVLAGPVPVLNTRRR